MFTLVLISLSFAAFLAATPGSQRIIGGWDIPIEKVPWQVSLQVKGQHNCGGSIYNESLIITAAHCVEKHFVEVLSVRAGSSKKNSGGVLHQVAAYKFHEKYFNYNSIVENDVAVIRLASPLPISENIQPIPLAEEDPAEGSAALSTGWGATYHGIFVSRYPIHLQGINIRIENKRKCRMTARELEENICAGVRGRSHCFGDSGGPLVVDNKLVGISSKTGNNFCYSSGYYASVAKFRSWILNALNEV